MIPQEETKATKEINTVMLGLDACGKTAILYKLKLGEVVTTIPTIGFNVETVNHGDYDLVIWDVGGQDKIMPLWRHYIADKQAVIFVLDSNDRDRLLQAKDELHKLLKDPQLQNAVFLIYANKQDLPNALTASSIRDGLGINGFPSNKLRTQECSATTGDGLKEGLDWICSSAQSIVKKPKPATVSTGNAEVECLKSRLDAIRELVKVLGAEGSVLVEKLNKILDAPSGSRFTVDSEGNVNINSTL